MTKILVLPSEVVGEAESGNSYAFPADNILMSDKTTTVEEAINNKPGEKTTDGGEIFNDYENNIAFGNYSHAEGYNTNASGEYSHAEGRETIASGKYSHVEGNGANALGNASHAEGSTSIARGDYSHAEGKSTANGRYSHAEGYNTNANGIYSHAEGYNTVSVLDCQHVQGKYNSTSSDYAHIVGWGTGVSDRKNIHTITTTGDGWFAGTVEGVAGFKIDDYLLERLNTASVGSGTGSYLSLKNGDNSIYSIDNNGNANFVGKVTVGTGDTEITPTADNDLVTKKYVDNNGVGRKTEDGGEVFNNATDANMDSHAEGVETTASGTMSHAEGNLTTASGNISHAEGSHTTASGASSHAEGSSSDAIGNYSHAEGRETEASGVASHAEGYQSNASGDYSHAEASGVASGDYSHAEGKSFATGNYSHAEGIGNTAYTEAQHVEGKYSEPDSEGLYAHIIGWGASDGDRKNINTIDTNGNGWFAGTVEGANGIKVGPSIITYNEDNQMITFNFE